MKLVAIWIEDYKIFKNKYFNFEDEFQFDFEFIDIERKLKITKKQREKYFHLYNEPINSLTGIIGANGCGKSSILMLLNLINYDNPLTHNVVLVFNENHEYQIVCYEPDKFNFFPEKKIKIQTDLKIPINHEHKYIFEKVNFIHYSSNFVDQNDKFIKPTENLYRSNQFQILNSLKPERIRAYLDNYDFRKQNKDLLAEESFNILKLYYDDRLERQISFLSRVNTIDSPIKEVIKEVKFPEKITIWFQSERILKLTNQLLEKTLYKKFGVIKEIIEYAKADLISFSNYPLNTEGLKNRFKNETILISFLYVWSGDLFVNNNNHTLLHQIEEQVSQFKVDETIYQQILDFMIGYEGKSETMKLSKINILLKELEDNLMDVVISQNLIPLNRELSYEITIDNSIWRLLKRFIEVGFSYDIGLINYSWSNNLSSGEEAMLTQFTELEHAIHHSDENQDIIVSIDEGEAYFHPEWQRNYINLLVKFFNYYLKKNDGERKIQIILTSHSPFIISDLTPNNLIVISKSGETSDQFGKEQTFGANIHDLLANNFFLENGFMGEFAKEKIKSLIDFLDPNQKVKKTEWNLDKAKSIIQVIGEPFLKADLEYLLKEKKESEMSNDEIDKEIDRLLKLKKNMKHDSNK